MVASNYSHFHIASGNDKEISIAVGITSDNVARVFSGEINMLFAGKTPINQTCWSEYSASIRLRTTSVGHIKTQALHKNNPPRLSENPSFNMGWEPVDERDKAGLTSGNETDDLCKEEETADEKPEEHTSAVVMAEEG